MKPLRCGAAALLLGGCTGFQTPLDPAGTQAASIHSIWTLMMWVTSFFYVLVLAFLLMAVFRRSRPQALEPTPTAHDPVLERRLGVWAVMIVTGLTLLIGWSFFVDRSLASTRHDQAIEVKVTGNQWWWRVEYQDGPVDHWFETANEIHLPVGQTARLKLETNDVIHSFWVPNLAGKEDMIPGRHNSLDITPTRIGVFRGQCAEFCGFQHAHMALTFVVQSPEDYNRWRAEQLKAAVTPAGPKEMLGRTVFETRACALCHKIDGTQAGGRSGPNLTHVAGRETIAAGTMPMSQGSLAGWISDPQGMKPGTKMPNVPLSAVESDALVAYLSSLK